MQLKQKQVSFKGIQKFNSKSFPQNPLFPTLFTLSQPDLEKMLMMTQKEFEEAGKIKIHCKICLKDLVQYVEEKKLIEICNRRVIEETQLQIALVQGDLDNYKEKCEIHQDLKEQNIKILEQFRPWILNFPRYFKACETKEDVFLSQLNFSLKQFKINKELKSFKDIEILLDDEYKGLLFAESRKVSINYDYFSILQLITMIFDKKENISLSQAIMKGICTQLCDQWIRARDQQQQLYQNKINFLRIYKHIVKQKLQIRLKTIEQEKQEKLLIDYIEQEKQQQIQKREKLRKKRKMRKQKKRVSTHGDSESDQFFDASELPEFEWEDQQNQSIDSDTEKEINRMKQNLNSINQERKLLRMSIKNEWENYQKQYIVS